MIDVILMEPEEPGNIGAVARIMKNFGCSSLVLVNPQCFHLEEKAKNRAKHAQEILEKAIVVPAIPRKKYHTLIATTGCLGTDYNIPRSPVVPEQLAHILPQKDKIGILFGREGTGLRNKEIEKCDFVVSIPASQTYPVLNISHAVAIILYEVFKKTIKKSTDHILFATPQEKKQAQSMIYEVLDTLSFPTASMKKTQMLVWTHILGKSFLTHREAAAIMGFFRKVRLSAKKK